ncbi:MAG TPA: DUF3108 domain-containing protein [Candidatus Udaeobacter sp.]|nr:DUF3108 domain-containing protein [Candidatus Udaeobacter sp.]
MKPDAHVGTICERHRRANMFVQSKIRLIECALAILFAFCTSCPAANWQSTISKEPPGNFSELRPLRATYRFGWSGLTAATGDVRFTRQQDKFEFDGTGRTVGFVRALWKFDGTHNAVAEVQTLHPLETQQTENYRSKKLVTHLAFTSNGVSRTRTEGEGAAAATKTREFNFPDLFDLHSAALYLRSQPLKERSVYRVVVYPATSAYLVTITVVGREKISVHAGSYNAIKLDLQLKRVGKHLELEPHRKFRRGTIWISDDADRVLLRVEAQIFVGTIFAELQSLHFESPQ